MSNLSVGRNDAGGLFVETVDKNGDKKPAADRTSTQFALPYGSGTGSRPFPGARVGMKAVSITYIGFGGGGTIHGFDTTQPFRPAGGANPYNDDIEYPYEEVITVDDQIQRLIGSSGTGAFLVLLESQ